MDAISTARTGQIRAGKFVPVVMFLLASVFAVLMEVRTSHPVNESRGAHESVDWERIRAMQRVMAIAQHQLSPWETARTMLRFPSCRARVQGCLHEIRARCKDAEGLSLETPAKSAVCDMAIARGNACVKPLSCPVAHEVRKEFHIIQGHGLENEYAMYFETVVPSVSATV
mmetsp:Transcript_2968/g.5665  ORF Transcript_2968/g.5665 Transcript_2968/m.5665 type:complete len:171 (-) Transcript_2968:316-828(-)